MTEDLIVYQKSYDLLFWIKPTVQRFAKVHKYSLGIELEKSAIMLLKTIASINYKKNKSEVIENCLIEFEGVKILIRLSKDFKLITIEQYEYSAGLLVEIEKMLWGIKKRLQ